jgi:hypothetical protein
MGVSVRGLSDPHLHAPCPQCGYATRYKQWPIKCACSDMVTKRSEQAEARKSPNSVAS